MDQCLTGDFHSWCVIYVPFTFNLEIQKVCKGQVT